MLPKAVTAIHAEYNITDTLSMFLAKALSDKVALQHASISSDLTSETPFTLNEPTLSRQPSTLTPLLTRSMRRRLRDSGTITEFETLPKTRPRNPNPNRPVSPPQSLSEFTDTDSSTDESITTTTKHHHSHQTNPAMSAVTQPLAEVKVTKMKECPMLTAG
jgi:hypothetical protein